MGEGGGGERKEGKVINCKFCNICCHMETLYGRKWNTSCIFYSDTPVWSDLCFSMLIWINFCASANFEACGI